MWRCVGETAHWAGGVACCALALELVARTGEAAVEAAAGRGEEVEADVVHLKKVARRV